MTQESPSLRDLVTFIARGLVDKPEAVEVEEIADGPGACVLELIVDEGDLGQVIGKQGRTARAIRSILSVASAKAKKRATLEILE